jgi:AhpD family alkylhydroperoxidase
LWDVDAGSSSPEALADEVGAALAVQLEQLSPQARAAFLLYTVFDAGLAEVARATGCSEARCRVLVEHASARVRERVPAFLLAHLPHHTGVIPMTQRLNYMQQSPELFKKFLEFSMALKNTSIETRTLDLVHVRASQINGCGFCLDMHVKEATIHGERPLRLHHLAIWRESTLFTPRERAALAWTEVLTTLPAHGVPDDVFDKVRTQLSEKELSDLTFSVMAINAWNRVNVAFRSEPGAHDKSFGLDKAGLA